MAAAKSTAAPADTTPPAPAPEPAPVSAIADTTKAPEAPKAAGAFEYTASYEVVYSHVPLTAHPYRPAVAPVDDNDPGVPERPATVFAWPDGAPDDRWTPTTKTPNQVPDNWPRPGASEE